MEAKDVAAVLAGMSDQQQQGSNNSHSSDANSNAEKKRPGRKKKSPEPNFPVEPRVIQVISKPKTYMNHSYRDFSCVPPELNHVQPEKIENMTFAQKVHHILSQEKWSPFITWMPHGRAFKILVPKRLEQLNILQTYFGHNRYSSFLRQLSNHGLKHITSGIDRNCYYHEFMLRDRPHLCKYMPEPRDARRLVPDPANEPDFYKISKLFPLEENTTKDPKTPPATAAKSKAEADCKPAAKSEPKQKKEQVEPPAEKTAVRPAIRQDACAGLMPPPALVPTPPTAVVPNQFAAFPQLPAVPTAPMVPAMNKMDNAAAAAAMPWNSNRHNALLQSGQPFQLAHASQLPTLDAVSLQAQLNLLNQRNFMATQAQAADNNQAATLAALTEMMKSRQQHLQQQGQFQGFLKF